MHKDFLRVRSTIQIGLVIMLMFLMPLPVASAQDVGAKFGVFNPVEVSPGSTVQVAVEVRDVEGLYAVDFTLAFDPDIVQVVDVEENMQGIQAGLGNFLDSGLLLFNEADNQEGTYHFVMSQYNPSEPKSGDGNIVLLTFKGLVEGESPITITNLEMLNGDIAPIDSQVIDATIEVTSGAATQAATIPVAQATGLILVREGTPTPQPTIPPTPTATQELPTGSAPNVPPIANGEVVIMATATNFNSMVTVIPSQEIPRVSELTEIEPASENKNSWLVANWWIAFVPLAVIITGSYYLLKLRAKKKEEIKNEEE